VVIEKINNKYKVILGSSSLRRKELLQKMLLKFDIKICNDREIFPHEINKNLIPEYLAKQKANQISLQLKNNFLLITADTIVIQNDDILHKPKNSFEAMMHLKKISNNTNHVITGVCIKSKEKEITFSCSTKVFFSNLEKNEIDMYVNNNNPYDKSGSYGIQDWIGHIGVKKIHGSYNNVVGLPTHLIYQKLKLFI
tara:strand:+ start:4694 stop:5281 length:588 start_codon:yes stop_codon:yes gene_type:complete